MKTAPTTGKIGRSKAYMVHCAGCLTKYWRVTSQLDKPEECGVCKVSSTFIKGYPPKTNVKIVRGR